MSAIVTETVANMAPARNNVSARWALHAATVYHACTLIYLYADMYAPSLPIKPADRSSQLDFSDTLVPVDCCRPDDSRTYEPPLPNFPAQKSCFILLPTFCVELMAASKEKLVMADPTLWGPVECARATVCSRADSESSDSVRLRALHCHAVARSHPSRKAFALRPKM